MKSRYGLLAAGIAALFAVGAISATSAPAPKVTGGGQTLEGTTGAGDTIAFVAQDTDGTAGNLARGQVQYVDREGDTQTVQHGLVSCLTYEGTDAARLAGTFRDGTTFEIFVQDNGEGANADDDLIGIYPEVTPDCRETQNEDDDNTVALARGNVQVH